MTAAEPQVAVVVPFRDYEQTLAAAVESVLAQTRRARELVLVDDGSRDGSAAVARRYVPPATYVRRKNGGAGAARNTGVRHSSAPFLAFCDADDLWLEDKLEHQLGAFAAEPALDVVFGAVTEFRADGGADGRLRKPRRGVPGALPSAMLIRREAFERVGPFEERWRVGEWAEWYTRMRAARLRERWLSDVLVRRRLHTSSSGVAQGDARGEYVRILRAHLERRREGDGR